MNRALCYASLLSLAVHGVILFGLSMPRDASQRAAPSAPLAARLVEPPAPPPLPPPQLPEKPLPVPQQVEQAKPPPAAAKPRLVPKPKALAKGAPPVAPTPEPFRSAPPAAPIAEPVAPAPAASTARIEPVPQSRPAPPAAVSTSPPSPGAEQAQASTREQYRLQVLAEARKHNRYPALARENNWEGEVRVYLEVGAGGNVSLSVKASSGHPVLDRQALEMFRRAQAAVPLPEALRGKEFGFELRAIYNLKREGPG